MLKIEGLSLALVGAITASIPLLSLFLPFLKDFISATTIKVVKDRAAIEKLRLDLDNLLSKEKYIQDINVLNVKMLRNIPFDKVNILLRKNISLTYLVEMSDITKKGLCTYVAEHGKIEIVSKEKCIAVKKDDIILRIYFISFLMTTIALFLTLVLFQEPIKIVLFFIFFCIFEIAWLIRRSPYVSYKELTKNEESINKLRDQGIIVVQTTPS